MLNSIVLQGRLVADPEIRTTTSGKSVASFTMAVDRDYVPKGGERQADFINCVSWVSTEFLSRYFKKGSDIVLRGSLQTRKYQDKEGNNRTATEVNVSEVHFGGRNNSSGETNSSKTPQAIVTDVSLDNEDDTLPF